MPTPADVGLVARFRRDVRHVARSLLGQTPSPVQARQVRLRPVGAASSAVALATRRLRVAVIRRETADAVTVVLADPTGAPLTYLPGQFFTLLVPIDGRTVRRAYSACLPAGAAGEGAVAITSKRVAGGLVSSYLNDTLRAGDELDVLGPSGNFTVTVDPAACRELVLLGGGSGITPLRAIAEAVLAGEPGSRVTLVHGNRGEDDIIFRDALDALAAAHPQRFTLRHVLEQPPAGWHGGEGRLDDAGCARALDAIAPTQGAEYFLCGPAPMMAAARATLLSRGVPTERIHEERFASPAESTASAAATAQPVVLRDGTRSLQFTAAPGQTLLDAGLAAGAPMAYSCTLGGCGACKVRLATGTVESDDPGCLTAEERAAGEVLACISRPTSPCTLEKVKP